MTTPTPSTEVESLAARGRVIEAIKLYRRETGVGLAEAKSAVDALPRAMGLASPKEARTSPGAKGSGHAAAFLAATILGLFGLGITSTGVVRSQVAATWPEVNGKIVQSHHVRGGAKTSDRVDVEYAYEVRGIVHTGTRINYAIIWGSGFTRATQRRYPLGGEVQVHYDPSDPTRSVLEVNVSSFYWLGLLVSVLALWWGAGQWIGAARRER
jgi:hypothetical protein